MSRILIVEDSRTQAEHLRLLLEEAGYTVEVALDAERALELFNASAFDMVVSDVVMPGESGYDLCHRLRQHPERGQVPVVLLTSLNDPLDILQGIECGADNYVTKPFEPESLLGRIRYIFANRARRATHKLKVGVEVAFLGRTLTVNSEKEQILDLLVATCEDVVRANRELRAREEELATAKQQLEARVRARTSELAEANRTLWEGEERFRLLLEGVKDYAIFMLDPEGRVASWNLGAERIKGYRAEEILGRHFSCFYPEEEARAGVPGRILEKARSEGRTEAQGWRLRKDGSRFWADVIVTALRDPAGRLRGFTKVTRDVTEQRRVDEQLRQAQKMEAVGRLAGGVAHDFNNLIQVITGCGELVLAALPADHPQREGVAEMVQAGQRAAALTRQLMAFSRKQVIAPRVLQLNAIIAEAGKMLKRLLGEDVALAVVLDPGLGFVKADPHQLEQVLVNLAVNARDAMPRGGKLTIETSNVELDGDGARLRPEAKPGRYVLLAVSDTGHGMDEATQSHIFEPFFTTKEVGKGTGLGLATVYGIVKQAGGFLSVYSEPGQGTTFKVYLPLVEEGAEEREPATRRPGTTPDAGSEPPPTETLLLVEDEEGVRALAREVLQAAGYTVLEASDGAAALRLCEGHTGPIHLLVSDVVMPGMGGRELADRLTALRPGLKVLFLSGYADDAVVRHGVLASQVAFLQKPFTVVALVRKVREVLASRAPSGP